MARLKLEFIRKKIVQAKIFANCITTVNTNENCTNEKAKKKKTLKKEILKGALSHIVFQISRHDFQKKNHASNIC